MLKKNLFGMMTLIIGVMLIFSFTACGGNKNDDYIDPFDELPAAERWYSFAASESLVTINHSVANDDVCTIVVGGTPETGQPLWSHLWKATAAYNYTARAGKTYEFKFEAWTLGADRKLNIQWYENQADNYYQGTEYDVHVDGNITTAYPKFLITNQRKTYAILSSVTDGQPIPKSGKQSLAFQCANQTGTFYVKIISIKEYNSSSNGSDSGSDSPSDDGNNIAPNPIPPKTLVIQEFPQDIFDSITDPAQSAVGIFPNGTTPEQAMDQMNVVAGANMDNHDVTTSTSGTGTLEIMIPLYMPTGAGIGWTGSGSYMIYVILKCSDGDRYFGAGPIAFSSPITTITFDSNMELFED